MDVNEDFESGFDLTLSEVAERFDLNLVKIFDPVTQIERFVSQIQNLVGEEGRVVRFTGGHMIKIKADHYLKIHSLISDLNLEKNVIKLVLNDSIDDLMSVCGPEVRANLQNFANDLLINLEKSTHFALNEMNSIKNQIASQNLPKNLAKKSLAVDYIPKYPQWSVIFFKIWDNNLNDFDSVFDLIKKIVLDNCNSATGVEKIRYIVKVKWNDYYLNQIISDIWK